MLITSPEPRLESVLETVRQVEGYLYAQGVSREARYMLTAAIESVLHERIAHALSSVPAPCIEIRIDREDALIKCEVTDNGAPFERGAIRGPLAEVLKEPGFELAASVKSGGNCVTITLRAFRNK